MTNLKSGFLAGFIATVVLSVLMVIKGMMGVMPELDVAAMLAGMIGAPVIVGWIVHFLIGTVAWGGGFAVLYDYVPGSSAVQKGYRIRHRRLACDDDLDHADGGCWLCRSGLGMMGPIIHLLCPHLWRGPRRVFDTRPS